MSSSIEVFNIGTPVSLSNEGDIKGTITGICLSAGQITYKVVWWDGRTRKEEWLQQYEVNSSQPKIKIGFTYPVDERLKELMKDVRKMKPGAEKGSA